MAASHSKDPENMKARLKDAYDAIAPVYDKWAIARPATRLKYLHSLLNILPTPTEARLLSVLELGCGGGVPVAEVLLKVPHLAYAGNDMSGEQIALAKANVPGAERGTWLEGDMTQLRFGAGSLDGVLAMFSLIHLPRAEQTQMLGQIHGWLRPGAYMLANFSEEEAETIVMEGWLHEKGWMYWSGWGADKTLAQVKEAGFEVVESKVEQDDTDAKFLWIIAKKV